MAKDKNARTIAIMVLATLLGLAGGAVGALFSRVYVWNQAFSIPLFGDIHIDRLSPIPTGPILTGARRVVVEQNTMVAGAIAAARPAIVGFFEARPPAATGTPETAVFDRASAYDLKSPAGQGVVMTSDGWILSAFSPPELEEYAKAASGTPKAKALDKLLSRYTVITADKRVFKPVQLAEGRPGGFAFWRVAANDLPVRRLVPDQDIEPGEIALAVDWAGLSQVTTVSGLKPAAPGPFRSSDGYSAALVLGESLRADLKKAFVFNLGGDLIGLVDKDGGVRSMGSVYGCVSCLLRDGRARFPSLGLSYLFLEDFAGQDAQFAKGALVAAEGREAAVAKGGPAEKAGLKAGDIILSVNNIEIAGRNDLGRVVSGFAPGDALEIVYARAGKRETARVTLGER